MPPTAYNQFVKKHMLAMHDSPMKATEKMKKVASLWHESKGTAKPAKKSRKTKGGSLLSILADLL